MNDIENIKQQKLEIQQLEISGRKHIMQCEIEKNKKLFHTLLLSLYHLIQIVLLEILLVRLSLHLDLERQWIVEK
jgi:hypothetical protein